MKSIDETPLPKRSSAAQLMVRVRIPLLVVFHLAVFTCVFWLAFLMRFTLDIPAKYQELFWQAAPVIASTKVLVFYLLRSFHGWWRYVHFSDVISLVKSSVVASLGLIAIDYFFLGGRIPRIVVLNDLAIGIVILGGLRSAWRVWDERIGPMRSRKASRLLSLTALDRFVRPTPAKLTEGRPR